MAPAASPNFDPAAPITMVFTDIVGSTAIKALFPAADLTTRNQLYLDQVLRPHRQRVEATLAAYGGRVVKTEGDAYFLVFADPIAAVTWATLTQQSHHQQPIATPTGPLRVRMGMHTGSPLPDGDDFIGQEVDYAARVSGLAQGGQVLLSAATATRLGPGGAIYDHGRHLLKGIGKEPIFEALYGEKRPQSVRSEKPLRWVGVILLSMVAGGLLGSGLHLLGLLEGLELKAYDQQLRLRPAEKPDDRLLIIKVTSEDLGSQPDAAKKQGSLSNKALSQLLQRLKPHQPRVIAVDIFRQYPIDPADRTLNEALVGDQQLIMPCAAPLSSEKGIQNKNIDGLEGIDPPREIPKDQIAARVGFVDTALDDDNIVRRQLIGLAPYPQSRCQTSVSLNLMAALAYLRGEGLADGEGDRFRGQLDAAGNLVIGRTLLRPLQPSSGAYHRQNDRGHQLMLNYRAYPAVARQLSLGQVLRGEFDPEWVRDRLVLIGTTAPSFRDYSQTPYAPTPDKPMAGLEIQAHSISQILSAVLDGRPLIGSPEKPAILAWLFGWSAIGSLTVVVIGSRRRTKAIALILLGSALVASHFVLLLVGGWLPIVATSLASLGSAGVSWIYWQLTVGPGRRLFPVIRSNRMTSPLMGPKAIGAPPSVHLLSPDRSVPPIPFSEDRTQIQPSPTPPPSIAPRSDNSTDATELGDTRLQSPSHQPPSYPASDNDTSLQSTQVDAAVAPRDRHWTKPARPNGSNQPGAALLDSRPAPPQELAHRYQVERILSAGGFGVTYLARDPQRPGSPRCVVKRLSPQTPEIMPIARRLFKTEAESLELLGHHSQIPRLLAYFEQDDTFYLIEEFIEGRPLTEELRADRPQSEAFVIKLLQDLLVVLAFIHDRQIIHRDLKPDNIIRRPDDRLVLIDFGAVKQAITDPSHTPAIRNTVVIGTRGYAAPEQLAGQPLYSSDLYALGMIAIEAFTGINPHRLDPHPETGTLRWQHLRPPSPGLGRILDRLSAYHFNDRYDNARQVLVDLELLLVEGVGSRE